jgi:GDP-4-dehydro-6-deoxy-D-mannose reductase
VGGFCGAHLVSRLRQEAGTEIAGLDRMAEPSARLDRYFQADITDSAAVESVVRAFAPDYVFHLAAISGSTASAAQIYEVNVLGTVHLLEAVRRSVPECRVVIAGSFAEYGPVEASKLPVTEETVCRPVGAYGITKYAATLTALDYARRCGLKAVVARPSNIVGPGVPETLVVGAMLGRVKRALMSSQPLVKVGDFDSERDFIDAGDAVDAYVRLAKSDISGEVFNLCSGRAYSIRQVAEMLVAHSSRPIELVFDPNLFPPSAIRSLYGSYEKAKKAIRFHPATPLSETLRAAWSAEIGEGVACE